MSSLQPPKILIRGAGIAGLTLAKCLATANRPFTISEVAETRFHHKYPITLFEDAYGPLLKFIGVSDTDFKHQVAARPSHLQNGSEELRSETDSGNASFRVTRSKLERFLSEGLTIKKEVGAEQDVATCLEHDTTNRGIASLPLLVGADGVHSDTRAALLPNSKPRVLPYVVINGRRRLSLSKFREELLPHFKGATTCEYKHENALLRVSYWLDEDDTEIVDVSYTYSRPAYKDQTDPLHAPNRRKHEAGKISDALYDELKAITPQDPLFEVTFDIEAVKQDRKLHWLMRDVSLGREHQKTLANANVILIGDAAHAEPVLGGEGANSAIADGVALARWLCERDSVNVQEFYEARTEAWAQAVRDSELRLQSMHATARTRL